MRTSKYVGPLSLPTELYRQLERIGQAEERDPLQQARWLLRQALTAPEPVADRQPEPVGAGWADEARP